MTSPATAGIFARIAASIDARGAAAPAPEVLQACDSRADNRRRSVLLSRDRVTIDRSYRGIAMRLSVPVSAYRGVCVGVRSGENGGFVYELRLAHRDPDLSVLLDEALDESRIWAEWRASAGFFGLPALIERNDGPEAWGAAAGSADSHGRRTKRRLRPGIVTRRAVRPEALATVHREDEIIAPE
ncbi:DUF6101 family protein [Lichenibacterium ramalinae]|uniref:Uncharacterized protein n=1 Tax=Lichenibacterium ramalinae TaxID=2316527 RepID=A0A4Q2RCS7_9HYPH|nr:DUF6101 family protein [Lichenibacterium ramalinae]RYB04988.1 hypothetical protein D3272_10985 [Lichenibacterium ramalinae]